MHLNLHRKWPKPVPRSFSRRADSSRHPVALTADSREPAQPSADLMRVCTTGRAHPLRVAIATPGLTRARPRCSPFLGKQSSVGPLALTCPKKKVDKRRGQLEPFGMRRPWN